MEPCSLKESEREIQSNLMGANVGQAQVDRLAAILDKKNKIVYDSFKDVSGRVEGSFNLIGETVREAEQLAIEPINEKMRRVNLVLLPLDLSPGLEGLRGILETAVADRLARNYNVFFGEQVRKKLEIEMAKKDCSAEKCAQNLAIEFNGELIADVRLDEVGSDTALSMQINNIISGEIEATTFDMCSMCNGGKLLRFVNSE